MGLLIFSVVGLLASPLLGLIAGGVVAMGAVASFKQSGNWSSGKKGELAVTDALKSLSNDYVLLNDLMLPDGRGNIDHLVIGPNGLFVIETKNYSSYVKCSGDDWYVNGQKIRSLSKQAKRNAMEIKKNLQALFAEHQTGMPFVNALLVFISGNGRLNINRPTIPVLRSSEVPEFIARYNATKRPAFATPELMRAIVHHLHLLQQKPDRLLAKN